MRQFVFLAFLAIYLEVAFARDRRDGVDLTIKVNMGKTLTHQWIW